MIFVEHGALEDGAFFGLAWDDDSVVITTFDDPEGCIKAQACLWLRWASPAFFDVGSLVAIHAAILYKRIDVLLEVHFSVVLGDQRAETA